ncbi:hypothetical protein UlMin_039028 [Ulmus minor]
MGSHSSGSSSGEEDGDAEWKAAIDSVATTTSSYVSRNGFSGAKEASSGDVDEDGVRHYKPKHYQIKMQKLLDEMLENTLEMVKDHPVHDPEPDTDPMKIEGGIRLFKHAPPGIVFDHTDELQTPRKRPKILPGKEIDEKSKKFKRRLQSVAIDGEDIIAAARDASQKSLARLEAKEATAKAAAKREEERVAELKKMRGEKWLPSLAREMQLKSRGSIVVKSHHIYT